MPLPGSEGVSEAGASPLGGDDFDGEDGDACAVVSAGALPAPLLPVGSGRAGGSSRMVAGADGKPAFVLPSDTYMSRPMGPGPNSLQGMNFYEFQGVVEKQEKKNSGTSMLSRRLSCLAAEPDRTNGLFI